MAGRRFRRTSPFADSARGAGGQDGSHEERHPMTDPKRNEYVMLPVATRDFIVQALRETGQQLSKTHCLRATAHILLEEGVTLTKANSFRIDHRDHLLLMSLAERLLDRDDEA
jgi:hypothetical protein